VEMPEAMARKYPRAGASWPWFWFFPAAGPLESLPDVNTVRELSPQYGPRLEPVASSGPGSITGVSGRR
jgi:hypothetical protein